MKVFVIGGVTSTPCDEEERVAVRAASLAVGASIAEAGHDLILCSPFEGAADPDVFRGAAAGLKERNSKAEFYFVDGPGVRVELDKLAAEQNVSVLGIPQPAPPKDVSAEGARYSWLLCQLRALEACHAIIALGGKSNGSANMLLLLAETKRKNVVPLPRFGGAAAQAFDRRRYELEDRLGADFRQLQANDASRVAGRLAEILVSAASRPLSQTASQQTRFFISYARSRTAEADFVETLLRRRNQFVFRDESDFGAGHEIPTAIREAIYGCDVFIAIWSQEYACSPWCYDELSMALDRRDHGGLEMWLLCVDQTRIIPPRARSLINFPIKSRQELEGRVVELLGRRQS